MYRIVRKEALKPTVILYEIEAPMVAKKAEKLLKFKIIVILLKELM